MNTQKYELTKIKYVPRHAWPDNVTYRGQSVYEVYAATNGWVDHIAKLVKQDTRVTYTCDAFLGYVAKGDYFLLGLNYLSKSYSEVWCSCIYSFKVDKENLMPIQVKQVEKRLGMFNDSGNCLDFVKSKYPYHIFIR